MKFYKSFLVCVIVILFVLPAHAIELNCESPTMDFGKVTEGEKLTHAFKIQNMSNKKIVINRIVSSCGCLVSSKKSFSLQPNESTDVPIEFDSMGYGGKKFEKNIILFVKKTGSEIPFKLSIKGEVEGIKMQDRVHIAFGQKHIFNEQGNEHYIFIQAPLKKDLNITLKTPEFINAQLMKVKENEEFKTTEWQIIFSLTKNIRTRLNTEIIVYTNVPLFEKTSIPIYIEPKPNIIATPPVLFVKKEKSNDTFYCKKLKITFLDDVLCVDNTQPQILSDVNTPLVQLESSDNCITVKPVDMGNSSNERIFFICIQNCISATSTLKVMLNENLIGKVPIILE
jgi:hypothetical protein